ncbi:PqiC family protein [Puniceibacterium confluentis]|uniref:PqiC family protein n=1 Tax=Puniceibacterium confluentis TaxID=1958944 RepID=UPI0011B3F052|nr:ABC-type transport auxiliary lipoprotein family protein [Puniceibacterium confluentis]
MKTHLFPKGLLVAATLSVAACSGGDIRYATPAIEPTVKVSSRYRSLEVVEVTLPTYAATEEIFLQQPDGAIEALGPLWADLPARAMTLQLARDLGAITGATVAPEPWPFRGFSDARVDVRFEEMVATTSGQFRIAGQYFVAPEQEGGERSGSFAIAVPLPEDASASQIAAARGAATLTLAEQIARSGLR